MYHISALLLLCTKYADMFWIDRVPPHYELTVSSHTVSCNKKTSMQLLSALCWLFRGPVSTISVCRSIFLFATLQSAPRPFDPSPEPPEAARYWSDNGLEWFSWPPLQGRLLAPKTHPVEMSQFTSVSISASVSGFCSFCVRQKVDAFLLSVPCPMNRFPPKKALLW